MKILVIGPERTGSMLVAKIIAHVTGVKSFGSWPGGGKVKNDEHEIYHVSLPRNRQNREYPQVNLLIDESTHVIITTRDNNISIASKQQRFTKFSNHAKQENIIAQNMLQAFLSHEKVFICSYETLVYYKLYYAKLLYHFLGIESDFIPEIYDGNQKYLK